MAATPYAEASHDNNRSFTGSKCTLDLISAISLTPGKLFPVRHPMSILLYFVKVSLTDVTVLTDFLETCYSRLTYQDRLSILTHSYASELCL